MFICLNPYDTAAVNMPKEKYEIKGKIGEGGTASVYFVVSKRTGKGYAFKVPSDGLSENTFEEVRIQKKLRNRYVPGIIDLIKIEEKHGILMEYKRGSTLEQYLKNQGTLDEAQVLRLGIDLCKILICMHERSRPVCYLDLKPSNIILKEDRLQALVDFGCAKEMPPGGGLLSDGKGTMRYAAPEQFGVGQSVGPAADLYALGKILLEAGGTGCLSENTSVLLKACVRTEPKERITSARELRRAFFRNYIRLCADCGKLGKQVKRLLAAGCVLLFIVTGVWGFYTCRNKKKGSGIFADGWEVWCEEAGRMDKSTGCELCKNALKYDFLYETEREIALCLSELHEYYENGTGPGQAAKVLYCLTIYLKEQKRPAEEILKAMEEFSEAFYRTIGDVNTELWEMFNDMKYILENDSIFSSADVSLRARALSEMLEVIERTKKGKK